MGAGLGRLGFSCGGGGAPCLRESALRSSPVFGRPGILEIQIHWCSGLLLFARKGEIEESSKGGVEQEGVTSDTNL